MALERFANQGMDLAGEGYRKEVFYKVIEDLWDAASDLGLDKPATKSRIEDLYLTFAAEWALYFLTSSPAIETAIQDDTTLGWLDFEVGGKTIRERLITRLQNS